jgi:hypothetical protein
MLWNASRLAGYAIEANDGAIGSVDDIFFDDSRWKARWFVVDTGAWLSGRRVLLSPVWVRAVDIARERLLVGLTREEVRRSPDVDADKPISRQIEERLYEHYRQIPYWYVPMGDASMPVPLREAAGSKPGMEERLSGDPSLRSLDEVRSYAIRGSDGDIGHVHDFLVDDQGWPIRYAVVATRNWWPGKKVLIAPAWISEISWTEREVKLRLTREAIRNSPEYDPTATVDRAYEERLHRHYDAPVYWD